MIRRLVRIFLPFAAILLPALPLQLYFEGNWYSVMHSYSLGMVFGIICYTYLCIVLVLSARIRYFDRLYGHDRVLIFHGYLALTAIILALVHRHFKKLFFEDTTFQMNLGAAGLLLFIAIAILTVAVMLETILHRIALMKKFRAVVLAALHLDYSHLKVVHNFMALALMAIIIHVFIASPTAEQQTRMLVMGGMGMGAIIVYIFHKFLRPLFLRRRVYTLSKVDNPHDRIVTITLQPEKRAARHVRAGQFVYLRILSPLCGAEEHPFTLSSGQNDTCRTVTVKALGNYTARLQKLQPGARALLDGPYGVFTPEINRAPYLFIAGGIGITPFLAIIRSWRGGPLEKPVALLWSVRTRAELIDRDVFDGYARENGLFHFIPAVTGVGESFDGPRRIIAKLMKPALVDGVRVYMCGPDGMRRGISKELKKMGVHRSAVHFERFSF